jgi:predicted acetyltransferase
MELRPPTADEADAFDRAAMWAFHRDVSEDDSQRWRRLDELDRQLAWFDDGRVVATTLAYSRVLTAPGGAAVPVAGVSAVTVIPTHRRRGLLTSMMRRQLADVRDRGEPLAILWSSEGTIYGRFGFGVSVYDAKLQAQRPRARLAAPPREPPDPLHGDRAEAVVDAMRAIHERVRLTRPGMLDRPGAWWEQRLRDPPDERAGAQALRAVFAGDEGYALYAVKPGRDDDGPAGEVQIRELMTTTPAARAALWAFLLDQDLTRRISWSLAPVDEPLRLMLDDPYALTVAVHEALWVRIIDVEAALRARSYAVDPDVVLDVADPFCDWVAGRYRLSADDCVRTDAPADLELDAAALGAAYLGATTFLDLAGAGRVRELSPGAVERASRAFRGDVAPWCPEIF